MASEVKIVNHLRGFASLSVFLFHLVCVTNGYIQNKFLTNFFHYGKYGVQIFFVISGFVIAFSLMNSNYTSSNFIVFLKKRLIRIEPPYIVIIILTLIFLFIRERFKLGHGTSPAPTIPQILLHLGYLIPFSKYEWLNIVFWTLAIEFQFYLLFSLIFDLFIDKILIRWIIQIISILLFFLIKSEATYFNWAPVFLLGINLALFKKQIIDRKELMISIAIMGSIIFYKLGMETFLFSILTFLIIYSELYIKSAMLDFFGQISYSLYLCHTVIAFTIVNIGFRFPQSLLNKLFFLAFAFFATVFCSYLLYRFVERRFKNIASAIKYR